MGKGVDFASTIKLWYQPPDKEWLETGVQPFPGSPVAHSYLLH